jgi:hypothetical protein
MTQVKTGHALQRSEMPKQSLKLHTLWRRDAGAVDAFCKVGAEQIVAQSAPIRGDRRQSWAAKAYLNLVASRTGGMPNMRAYSRLNCEGLS